jgi:predicted nucleic acid-binding protein
MKVFLDASALVPVVIPRDQWRPRTLAHLKALQALGGVQLATSNWTFYEAAAITKRAGHEPAVRLRRWIGEQASLVAVSPSAESEAVRRFFAWSDKTASVVDHANLLTAIELGCDAVLSFDDDFVQIAAGTGVRVLR